MKAMVISGFERSGNDSKYVSLCETGVDRGHSITGWRWREHIDVEQHPLFHVHRIATPRSGGSIASIMADEQIARGMCRDLGASLPVDGYDAIITTNTWAALIAADALLAVQSGARLVDCHGEFCPMPFFTHERIDSYVGGWLVRERGLSLNDRVRVKLTGVPVRGSFRPSGSKKRHLVVNSGTDAWAIEQLEPTLKGCVAGLEPQRATVLASSVEARQRWVALERKIGVSFTFAETTDEIAGALAEATWFMTKAGGAAVAEGLASGCRTLVYRSGVFWEDEARAYLSAARVVFPVNEAGVNETVIEEFIDRMAVRSLGKSCRRAAVSVWESAETHDATVSTDCLEASIAAELLDRVHLWASTKNELPNTSAAMLSALKEWARMRT